jgi:CDP-6-deoxy-D-xylo-4-hexulose-3-dehydrase
VQLRQDRPETIRVIGDLAGADSIMNNTIFIGTYPGLTDEMLSYVIQSIQQFATDRTVVV